MKKMVSGGLVGLVVGLVLALASGNGDALAAGTAFGAVCGFALDISA